MTAKDVMIYLVVLAVIDEDVLTNHKAIEAIHQAELIDLKQNFEKWEYKY